MEYLSTAIAPGQHHLFVRTSTVHDGTQSVQITIEIRKWMMSEVKQMI